MMDLNGLHVLVTGGTGSLGRRVVRRLVSGELGIPAEVTVFSRDEAKQHDMRLSYAGRPAGDEVSALARRILRFRVGDVRDFEAVDAAVRGADVVVHAAGLKQVPTCEDFPSEAVKTNVLGAQNLVRAVVGRGDQVRVVVAVSTDKACKPVNVMGMTKALLERLIVHANVETRGPRFVCVRHGNVVGSRGSVVPVFRQQIGYGGPVTITDPAMTRFLLTLDRAVDGVFAAMRFASPGEIYVPKVDSARIVDVANVLIAGRDIPMVVTGIRPGEKIHEILVSDEEGRRTIERDGYYVIRATSSEIGESERPLGREYSSTPVTLDLAGIRQLLEARGTEMEPAA